jgi:lysyl-tRNA synthetase class 2
LDSLSFRKKIQETTPEILPADELAWDDLFFLVFINKIEPELKKEVAIFVDEYPYHLAALSKISTRDPRVCERFELYCQGVELANCFYELTDLEKQKSRFLEQNKQKQNLYGYQLPDPELLYKSLEKGLPTSCGIALGVDRLLQLILGREELFYDFN